MVVLLKNIPMIDYLHDFTTQWDEEEYWFDKQFEDGDGEEPLDDIEEYFLI